MATRIVKLEEGVKEVRNLVRAGDDKKAWRIMEWMMAKITPAITKRIAHWRYNRDNFEDVLSLIQLTIYTEWRSLAKEHHFWEVNFGWDLTSTINKILQGYNNKVGFQTELQMNDVETQDGKGKSWFDQQAAPVNVIEQVENNLFIRQALAQVTPEEQEVFLAVHYYGMKQKDVAKEKNITDRTVRNILMRAEEKMARFVGEEKAGAVALAA